MPAVDAGSIVNLPLCSIEDSDNALSVSTKCTHAGIRLIASLASLGFKPTPIRFQFARKARMSLSQTVPCCLIRIKKSEVEPEGDQS